MISSSFSSSQVPTISPEARERMLEKLGKLRQQQQEMREAAVQVSIKPDLPLKYALLMWIKLDRELLYDARSDSFPTADDILALFTPVTEDGYTDYPDVSISLMRFTRVGRLARTFGTVTKAAWYWLNYWSAATIEKERNQAMMTPHEEVEMKLATLREGMLSDTPMLPSILSQIKTYLSRNPEVVTLLTEDQIGEIVRAAQHTAKVKLVEAAVKTKVTRKKLADTTMEDLM